ncbi:hypothetical protein CW309_04340 [Pseudomonas hunanensis]|jgi:hypothetical protein|nr:hypothetical protein CW309_04340 [Pseudomonas hunanensis]
MEIARATTFQLAPGNAVQASVDLVQQFSPTPAATGEAASCLCLLKSTDMICNLTLMLCYNYPH